MFITIPPYGSVGTILMQTEISTVTQFGESQTVKTSGPVHNNNLLKVHNINNIQKNTFKSSIKVEQYRRVKYKLDWTGKYLGS